MKEIKQDTYKGTRILVGNEKRILINTMVEKLIQSGFNEISIPNIQLSKLFKNKVGEENNNMMYSLTDRGGRELCLAPEYTAIVQNLSNTIYKYEKDVKLFYVQECFRGEKPQAGRYRQFTQFGVEVLNPTNEYDLPILARDLCELQSEEAIFSLSNNVKRGLDYYNEGQGFEITCDKLGNAKQLCGGGAYKGGVGFAIGIDRLILV